MGWGVSLEKELALAIAEVEYLAKAGDILAEMFGYAIAAIEAGEGFTDTQMDAAREGIIVWHRIRAGQD